MKTILKQAIITEKSMLEASKGVYTFEVGLQASKSQIKALVEQLFSVQVNKVTTTIRKPKQIRVGRRRTPKLNSPRKFARVWLKSGDSIDLFEFKEQ